MYDHKTGITLRKVTRDDLPDLLALKAESWWGTHRTLIANDDDQQKWFDSIPANALYMLATAVVSGKKEDHASKIGVGVFTDIDPHNRSLRISGSVFKDWRTSPRAKDAFAAGLDFAFEMLNVDRVEAEVLGYHATAQQIEIDFLGLTVEGRRRQAVYKCGRYYDSIVMGMLREEWAAHPRVTALGDTCNKNFSHARMARIADRFSPETAKAAGAR